MAQTAPKGIELGLIEKREQRFARADIIRKGTALAIFVFAFAFILKQFNGADTFCVMTSSMDITNATF